MVNKEMNLPELILLCFMNLFNVLILIKFHLFSCGSIGNIGHTSHLRYLPSKVQGMCYHSQRLKWKKILYAITDNFAYIKYCIVLFLLLLFWILDPSCKVIDKDELKERCIDEEHTDSIPHVHCSQIRNNW